MSAELPWTGQASRIADVLAARVGEALIGVYVHGSAALGGWVEGSDLDVLVVADDAGSNDWQCVGRALQRQLSDRPVVELSAVSATAAKNPVPPWSYLFHVSHGDGRVVTDHGAGDPDLCLHYLVTRAAGLAMLGPPAPSVIGEVSRNTVLAQLSDELTWGLEHADAKYAVLNACRAMAYAEEGRVLSKADGARWVLGRRPEESVVWRALDAQRSGRLLGRAGDVERRFVRRAREQLG